MHVLNFAAHEITEKNKAQIKSLQVNRLITATLTDWFKIIRYEPVESFFSDLELRVRSITHFALPIEQQSEFIKVIDEIVLWVGKEIPTYYREELKRSMLIEIIVDPIEIHFLEDLSYYDQLDQVISKISLTKAELEGPSVLIRLPGNSEISAMLLSKLHGIMGHFPTILRLRKIIEYEVVDIVDLQDLRDRSRPERWQ
jgi:hypothetical protein